MQILSTNKDCRSARNKIDVDFFVKIRVGPDEDKSVLSFLSADTMLDTDVITMMLACSEDIVELSGRFGFVLKRFKMRELYFLLIITQLNYKRTK
jgi:hypothetical protein